MRSSLLLVSLFLFPFGSVPCWSNRAAAADPAIAYEAPSGCPSHDDGTRQIAARAPHVRDAEVRIETTAGGFVGHAKAGSPSEDTRRRVDGRTCEGVVEALVLGLALGRPDAEPAAPPPPAAAPPTSAFEAPSDADLQPETAHAHSPVEIGIGIDALSRTLGPATVFGATVFAQATLAGVGAAHWYRPSVRVGGFSATGKDTLFNRTMTAVGGTFEVCPLAAAPVSAPRLELVVGACGAFNVASAGSVEKKLWTDAGAILRASLQFGAQEATHGFIETSGGLLQRLGDSEPTRIGPIASPQNIVVVYPTRMWTVGLGGGIVFP